MSIRLIAFFFAVANVSFLQVASSSISPIPVDIIFNPTSNYSLVNSVDYHPKRSMACVTYTQANTVGIYIISPSGKATLVQSLTNPVSKLNEPQHAIFSPNGKLLVVANWTNDTFTLYNVTSNGTCDPKPFAVYSRPLQLEGCKPHGICFSPNGRQLAVAYGAGSNNGRALALYSTDRISQELLLIDALVGDEALPGIPKGIAFAPNGQSVLVTFADLNRIAIYDVMTRHGKVSIDKTARQVIEGDETLINRPEDIKLTADKRHCAVSNSNDDTVTFYPFDPATNTIIHPSPSYLLQNPDASLCFPHGLAFSPDGTFLLVTQFGPVSELPNGHIFWTRDTPADSARVTIYRMRSLNH